MDAETAIRLKEAEQKLVDAINMILPKIPESLLSVELIRLPDGGAEFRYHMSKKVYGLFEGIATMRGMTLEEHLRSTVFPEEGGRREGARWDLSGPARTKKAQS